MQNVGTPDRIIRFIVGALLIVAALVIGAPLFASAWVFWGSIAIGAVLVATAAFGFCPIYAALRLSTRCPPSY